MSTGILNLTNDLRNYLQEKGMQEHKVLTELREETARIPESVMQICPEQGALMANLIRLMSAKKTIEIGTFTGYSSLAIAKALPPNGKLLCCDVSEEWTSVASDYWKKAGVAEKIDLVIAPAKETLANLPDDKKIDFAFIDADKGGYKEYYEQIVPRLSDHGLIAIDNVLWSGRVVDPKISDEDTVSIRNFNDHVYQDDRVSSVMLSVGDGLTLVKRTN